MPTPYTRGLRRTRHRNRRQFLWSLLVLAIGLGILWWQQQSSLHHPELLSPSSAIDTSAYIAERFPGSPAIHVMFGVPRDANSDDDILIQRPQYVLSYNPSTRCANWVCWNLSAWWYGSAPRHRGPFLPDPLLPPSIVPVYHRDYTNSGYDRGHLVRSEERTRSIEDNITTFYTTNIIPQHRALNAGPWLRFEEYIEQLCKRSERELYIIAGPIYHDTARTTIGSGIRVPSECFKIVVLLPKGRGKESVTSTTEVIAVRMPNRANVSGTWEQFVCSVADIEKATGYRFFTAIPDSIAQAWRYRRPIVPAL
ncbi:MAG: DNA/RNA non-specific endonuclease [Candidatus Kapabacteria bacterium]|nr:DNA/RNA non-specific endonuclease [Candidatus Kapabacteria bacterium]MCX7937530.1 DNA/RNA non-specific endonuclease [Chlorobiota bacterium]